MTPWTIALQVPLSLGLPFPFPGDLPNPGIKPGSPALQVDSSLTELQGKPQNIDFYLKPACQAKDMDLNPGSGRSPGEGNGNPLQYSCLENTMDGGAWRATVHGVAKNWTQVSNKQQQFKYST